MARRERRAGSRPLAPKERFSKSGQHSSPHHRHSRDGENPNAEQNKSRQMHQPHQGPQSPRTSNNLVTSAGQKRNGEPGAGHCARKLRCFPDVINKFYIVFLMEFMVSQELGIALFQNHRQSSYLPTKCTNPIKLLNHHEPPTTLEQALARRERRAGCWPLSAEGSLSS